MNETLSFVKHERSSGSTNYRMSRGGRHFNFLGCLCRTLDKHAVASQYITRIPRAPVVIVQELCESHQSLCPWECQTQSSCLFIIIYIKILPVVRKARRLKIPYITGKYHMTQGKLLTDFTYHREDTTCTSSIRRKHHMEKSVALTTRKI